MVTAFFAFTFMVLLGWPFAIAILLSIGIIILLSLAIERLALRPLLNAPISTIFIATLA